MRVRSLVALSVAELKLFMLPVLFGSSLSGGFGSSRSKSAVVVNPAIRNPVVHPNAKKATPEPPEKAPLQHSFFFNPRTACDLAEALAGEILSEWVGQDSRERLHTCE